MLKNTPLYAAHCASGAKMVDFHGWMLPLHYGSQLEEHHTVRQDAGVFDVSHMTIVDLVGEKVTESLRYLMANDVAKLKSNGRALYTAMLNETAGVIDDLIVYKLSDSHYRLVLNAATREKDLAWLQQWKEKFGITITPRFDWINLAIQGPNAREKTIPVLPKSLQEKAAELKPFACFSEGEWQVSRTGYTGEDGFEVLLPISEVEQFWNALLKQGVHPCGLGARDTLRLEAGLNLYGSDMDETVTPLEANIAWTVALKPEDRDFIGREALEKQKQQGDHAEMVGLLLTDRGVLRAGQKVFQHGEEVGVTISGGFSPTLKQSIAFARVNLADYEDCQVEVRGKQLNTQIVKLPFVRHGKSVFKQMKEVEC